MDQDRGGVAVPGVAAAAGRGASGTAPFGAGPCAGTAP
jgi:hypothetical protein